MRMWVKSVAKLVVVNVNVSNSKNDEPCQRRLITIDYNYLWWLSYWFNRRIYIMMELTRYMLIVHKQFDIYNDLRMYLNTSLWKIFIGILCALYETFWNFIKTAIKHKRHEHVGKVWNQITRIYRIKIVLNI